MAKTVVILGAGWAGLPLAHKLLKYTVPKVKDLKIILVSPNSHFYWNVAATRGIIPGAISDERLFLPIQPAFAQWGSENFRFVLGKATKVDVEKSVVELDLNDGSTETLGYDQLVIATGSRVKNGLPFKPIGTHEETIIAYHGLQKRIEAAKSIVIAGGGPTGVEVAGELAAAYGAKKEITLVIGSEHTLQGASVLPAVSKTIEQDLRKLGVKLIYGARVVSESSPEGDAAASKTTLTLTDDSTLVTDLYLPLTGIQLNTSFIANDFLDKTDSLVLEKTMRVKGTTNVWGIGDVGNLEPKQLTVTDGQIIYLAATLDSILTSNNEPELSAFKPTDKTMVFVSLGKKYATGQIGNWKLWGFMVSYVKGRKLFVDIAEAYVGGKQLRHASM